MRSSEINSNGTVGVVVLNYGKPDYCLACVESFLRHETYKSVEIVVVDNATPDLQMRQELKNQLPEGISFIQNVKNCGYSAGNNVGARFLIEERQVSFILILNSDTLISEPIVSDLLDALKDPNIAAVSPLVVGPKNLNNWQNLIQVRRLPSILRLMVVNTTFVSRLPIFRKWSENYQYQDLMPWGKRIYKSATINGAAFAIKAKILADLGYLDERTFLYYEELILGFKLRTLGFECALHAKVKVIHMQGLSTGARERHVPFAMFTHMIKSFEILGIEYYNQPSVLMKSFSIFRYIEFFIKNLILWLSGKL